MFIRKLALNLQSCSLPQFYMQEAEAERSFICPRHRVQRAGIIMQRLQGFQVHNLVSTLYSPPAICYFKVLWVYLMMQKMVSEEEGVDLGRWGELLLSKTSLMVAGPSLPDLMSSCYFCCQDFSEQTF